MRKYRQCTSATYIVDKLARWICAVDVETNAAISVIQYWGIDTSPEELINQKLGASRSYAGTIEDAERERDRLTNSILESKFIEIEPYVEYTDEDLRMSQAQITRKPRRQILV